MACGPSPPLPAIIEPRRGVAWHKLQNVTHGLGVYSLQYRQYSYSLSRVDPRSSGVVAVALDRISGRLAIIKIGQGAHLRRDGAGELIILSKIEEGNMRRVSELANSLPNHPCLHIHDMPASSLISTEPCVPFMFLACAFSLSTLCA